MNTNTENTTDDDGDPPAEPSPSQRHTRILTGATMRTHRGLTQPAVWLTVYIVTELNSIAGGTSQDLVSSSCSQDLVSSSWNQQMARTTVPEST